MTKEKKLQTRKVDKNPIATCQDAFMLIYWLHQILTPPFQTRWCFSTLLFSSCGESVWIVAFPVLKWHEWHLTKSFFKPICLKVQCVLRWDSLLHSLIVTSGYLSCCVFLVSSKQSGRSPLMSGIDNFHVEKWHLLEVFTFLDDSV